MGLTRKRLWQAGRRGKGRGDFKHHSPEKENPAFVLTSVACLCADPRLT